MEIKTKTMGVKNVEPRQIVTFPEGLFGFEDFKKYAVMDSEYEPFIWLQSVDEPSLAFFIIDPFMIFSDYEADIDDASLEKISVKAAEDIVVMAIVTVPSGGGEITANLQGPVVINKRNNLAAQVILTDSRWNTKHDIRAAVEKRQEGK